MLPDNVRTRYFHPIHILYDGGPGKTSVAWGRWMPGTSEETFCVATRWNGEDDENGYPSSRGYPQWFIADEWMEGLFLQHIAFGPFDGAMPPRRLNRRAAVSVLGRHYLPEGEGAPADAAGGDQATP